MIQDLHSHTYYSFCGKDRPEEIVEAAIAGGIELFGISDHAHGVGNARHDVYKSADPAIREDYGRTLLRYFDHISLIKEKYADRIRVLCGIEVSTRQSTPRVPLPASADISFFDYCIIEDLDDPTSLTGGDPVAFAARCGCPMGVAHTDLFAHIKARGEDPFRFCQRMAKAGVFWELNVNLDSIHHYREHEYVAEFLENEEQQAIVRESGLRLSVGFDGHRVEDYRPGRVQDACERIAQMGIKLVFEE